MPFQSSFLCDWLFMLPTRISCRTSLLRPLSSEPCGVKVQSCPPLPVAECGHVGLRPARPSTWSLEIPGTIHHPSFDAGFMIRPGKQTRLKGSFSNVPIETYTCLPASGRVVLPPSLVLSLPFLFIVLVPVLCYLIVPQWVDCLLRGLHKYRCSILFFLQFSIILVTRCLLH